MHDAAIRRAALALRLEGMGARRAAQRLGLPTSTVRDWFATSANRRDEPARCPACDGPAHHLGALGAPYVYLLGLYLGDGCVSPHHRGVFRLRITLDARYPGIVEHARQAVENVRGGPAVARRRPHEGCFDVGCFWKGWPCLLPQHGPGLKHHRRIELAPWQQPLVERWPDQLLRGLIHSDGCRAMNTGTNWRHPRYSFTNVSDDIRRIFCDACDRTGVNWTTAGDRTVYVSRKADVAHLDEFIGPKR